MNCGHKFNQPMVKTHMLELCNFLLHFWPLISMAILEVNS